MRRITFQLLVGCLIACPSCHVIPNYMVNKNMDLITLQTTLGKSKYGYKAGNEYLDTIRHELLEDFFRQVKNSRKDTIIYLETVTSISPRPIRVFIFGGDGAWSYAFSEIEQRVDTLKIWSDHARDLKRLCIHKESNIMFDGLPVYYKGFIFNPSKDRFSFFEFKSNI